MFRFSSSLSSSLFSSSLSRASSFSSLSLFSSSSVVHNSPLYSLSSSPSVSLSSSSLSSSSLSSSLSSFPSTSFPPHKTNPFLSFSSSPQTKSLFQNDTKEEESQWHKNRKIREEQEREKERREEIESEKGQIPVEIVRFPLSNGIYALRGVVVGVFTCCAFWVLYQLFYSSPNIIKEVGNNHKTADTSSLETVSFDDVLGCDEVKEEVRDIISFLKDPEDFRKVGAELTKGVLLVGPPGTGKTLIARAVAGEAGVPFIYCSASEFDEVFVGVGARRVRSLFKDAKESAPSVIFIDEIDSLGSRNKEFESSGDRTLNQLLSLMDGFEKNSGVIVIAATNHPEALDNALKRSGRFDREIRVNPPDIKGRISILNYYLEKVTISPEVDDAFVKTLAQATVGMTGADLANLVNQAAVRAASADQLCVDKKDLDAAYEDVLMGSARKGAVLTDKQKRLTAFHEGGHAVVAWCLKDAGSHPIRRATILPRGASLGHVSQVPKNDQHSFSRKEMQARIAVAMGGRVAEEMIFGKDEVTTGASSDLKGASALATEMVARWGMSEKLGPRTLIDYDTWQDVGSATRNLIDEEINKILVQQEKKAREILRRYERELRVLADALLKYETLTGDEVDVLLGGGTLQR